MRARLYSSVFALSVVISCLGTAEDVDAQGLTGQIGGTVVDGSGGVLPGVTVSVRNVATQTTREAVTDANGAFVITNLLAGTYDLSASLAGFKVYAQRVVLTATERVALPPITLEVGGLNETVSVTAELSKIQTQSGERSAVITAEQIEDVGLRGRDFMGLLRILPGVDDTSERDAPGWNSVGSMSINGQSSFNFSFDGITNKDTGSNSGNYAAPALDSIAQVKVQASNFQAEYGRTSGATIVVVTKSGSSKFKGSAAYYRRNEAYNANTWDRRRSCDTAKALGTTSPNCARPQYRYDNAAYTIGGPVLIPGMSFNRNRDKLFFFWSQDLLPRKDPGGLQNSTMPTALERAGDFSQTVNTAGRLRFIRDPLLPSSGCNVNTGGPSCFPGNIIPPDRINAIGQKMLNMFPLPNATDPTGTRQFNYQWEGIVEKLRTDQALRVDWNMRSGTTFYSRLQFGKEVNARGYTGTFLFLQTASNSARSAAWPQMQNSYDIDTISVVNTLLHSFNASTVLEVTAGVNWSKQSVYAVSQRDLDAVNRDVVLPELAAQFFPRANPLHIMPNLTFGGGNALPNTRSIGGFENRYPFNATNPTWDYTANVTKLRGSHNLKAGIFIEHSARPAQRGSAFNGSFDFGANGSNPFDTNFGFANAQLGTINSYTESTAHPFAEGRFNQVEFFGQDNWRVKRNLTFDLGVRVVYIGPTYVAGQKVAYFDPAKWDAARAPQLFEAICPGGAATCAGTVRMARNPITGEILNNTFIGKLVPGSGDFYNGMVVADGTVPTYKGLKLHPSPRVGFAWDITGDGRTAVRGGYGVNFDRYADDDILSLVEQPPLVDTMQTAWTTLPLLLSSPLIQSPRGVNAFTPYQASTVHNWSIGAQRALPFGLTADVAYVGNTTRNVARNIPINDLTPAQLVDPANRDPTQNNAQRKDANYLRPYRGFGGINERRYFKDGVTYHSIQVGVTRRLSRGFSGGLAYTGSRSKGLRGWDWFRTDADNRARFTTAAGNPPGASRPHNLVFHYDYRLPDVSQHLGAGALAQGAMDGWQISGVTRMTGGVRSGFTYGFTGAPAGDLTQGLGGSRVVLVCDPKLPRSQRTFDRQFRTECVRPPGPLTNADDTLYQGSALGDEWTTLGFVSHDVTIFKNFRLKSGANLRVQVEMYNAPNWTQYSGVNTRATFDYATGEQTDPGFGRVNGVRANSNRVIQLATRFTF